VNWNNRLEKQKNKILSYQYLKMPNKTKQKKYIKSIKKYERRKKQFESHTSHDSLSSIPYRSNGWSWNPNWHWKNIQSFRKQLIQCLSLLYLSALRIKQHPSNLCLQCVAPPLPYPAVPTLNLVVSRTRPLNPVPRPPKQQQQSRPCLCAYLVRCFFFALMLFLKLVLYTQSLELYVNIFFISHP